VTWRWESAGDVAELGRIVATIAVLDVTVGADDVAPGAVDAWAREHLTVEFVSAPAWPRGSVIHG
jgi:hypothetical protein